MTRRACGRVDHPSHELDGKIGGGYNISNFDYRLIVLE